MPLVRDVFLRGAYAREYAMRLPATVCTPLHEDDVAVGMLIHVESTLQRLPLMHVALKKWTHNRFWVDVRNPETWPDAHVIGVHKVYDGFVAELVGAAYARVPRSADRFDCVDCAEGWLWEAEQTEWGVVPLPRFACCHKSVVRPSAWEHRTTLESNASVHRTILEGVAARGGAWG